MSMREWLRENAVPWSTHGAKPKAQYDLYVVHHRHGTNLHAYDGLVDYCKQSWDDLPGHAPDTEGMSDDSIIQTYFEYQAEGLTPEFYDHYVVDHEFITRARRES